MPTSGTISLFGLDGTNTLYAGLRHHRSVRRPTPTLSSAAPAMTASTSTAIRPRPGRLHHGNNALYATGVNATLPENVDTLQLFGSRSLDQYGSTIR